MHKVLNVVLVLAVLVSAFLLYSLEHSTRGLERQIAELRSDMTDERETMKLLQAEWSSLTRPERLQKLAADNLKLQPIKASQFAAQSELGARLPERVSDVATEAKPADPINDILQKMQ
ncbi:MAG: cell division protein FtsL [Rhizobiales bacterium]|nr:cell division protein FtsL [Hyphomicrobiales bacterium]